MTAKLAKEVASVRHGEATVDFYPVWRTTMPSFRFNTPLHNTSGPLEPGQSHQYFSRGLRSGDEVAYVTAVPANDGEILAIQNLRTVGRTKDAGPIAQEWHILYDVKNVGSESVENYQINVAIFVP
jgi:hypothetical protein